MRSILSLREFSHHTLCFHYYCIQHVKYPNARSSRSGKNDHVHWEFTQRLGLRLHTAHTSYRQSLNRSYYRIWHHMQNAVKHSHTRSSRYTLMGHTAWHAKTRKSSFNRYRSRWRWPFARGKPLPVDAAQIAPHVHWSALEDSLMCCWAMPSRTSVHPYRTHRATTSKLNQEYIVLSIIMELHPGYRATSTTQTHYRLSKRMILLSTA